MSLTTITNPSFSRISPLSLTFILTVSLSPLILTYDSWGYSFSKGKLRVRIIVSRMSVTDKHEGFQEFYTIILKPERVF